jgi:protein Tob/BTG
VEFLRQFLAKYGQLTQTQIDLFATKLTQLLEKRYVNHWYENYPMKGQAFRCLRVKRSEDYLDPVLDQILKELNLSTNQLGLPNDFTLWIDPGEVNVRFGDQAGYTYSIARVNKNDNSNASSSIQDSSYKTNPNETTKSLIVENSAKIFDEKLTAFIRQNSCNNPIPTQNKSSLVDEEDLDKDIISNDLIENLIKLTRLNFFAIEVDFAPLSQ